MICPICASEVKLIPAGVGKKTGKSYKAFYACQNKSCNYTAKAPEEKPPGQPTQVVKTSPTSPETTPAEDMIVRGLGLVRGDIKFLQENVEVLKQEILDEILLLKRENEDAGSDNDQ